MVLEGAARAAEQYPSASTRPAPTSKMAQQLIFNLKQHELPEWRRDNPDILGYFRASKGHTKLSSWNHAFESVFYLHNETFNIWSHGMAVVLFVYLGLSHALGTTGTDSFLPLLPFFVGATMCFILSTL
jgi:adiponectin receptor